MKIAIIANCQGFPLQKVLATFPEVTDVVSLPIHLYGTQHFALAENKFKALLMDANATILTFPINERFKEYSTSHLRLKGGKLLTMTNIFFSGLHPDITYVGLQAARLSSPIGDYHSKIIIESFIAGRKPSECIKLFNEKEFEARGYFDEYGRSGAILLTKDESLDVKFAAKFLKLLKNEPALFTVNHPTGLVFEAYRALIAEQFGLTQYPAFPPHYFQNPLANSAWWPVFPCLAERHGLSYRTPILFRQPEQIGGRFFTLEEFVNRSYAIYEGVKEQLIASPQVLRAVDGA